MRGRSQAVTPKFFNLTWCLVLFSQELDDLIVQKGHWTTIRKERYSTPARPMDQEASWVISDWLQFFAFKQKLAISSRLLSCVWWSWFHQESKKTSMTLWSSLSPFGRSYSRACHSSKSKWHPFCPPPLGQQSLPLMGWQSHFRYIWGYELEILGFWEFSKLSGVIQV